MTTRGMARAVEYLLHSTSALAWPPSLPVGCLLQCWPSPLDTQSIAWQLRTPKRMNTRTHSHEQEATAWWLSWWTCTLQVRYC